MSEKWYTDESGITHRRKPQPYPAVKCSTFWHIFGILNLVAIVGLVGVFIWAGFDIHERLPYVLTAQIPALVMLAIRKILK